MNISINPSYFCNFRCNFCYLTPEQLADQNKIDLEVLDQRLAEVKQHTNIDWIDLYGGEIGALKKDYFYSMRDVIRKHYKDKINIITNFSMLHEGFFEDDFYLSVSYDFDAREKHDKVLQNMLQSPVPIAVLILASSQVIKMNVDHLIKQMNLCSSIESVEIKPYSSNQANQHNVTHRDFELFVQKWLESPIQKNFDFINEGRIVKSLKKEYNAFSNDHVYITPSGKFGVLEFDNNDHEYFLELDTFKDYLEWADKEPTKNVSDICRKCNYYGNCLTEHYRYVKDLDNSCNGYKGLLDYYARMEN
jgi:sulfatase maturation enzyme AslB (radical SAM superfamily)